MPASSPVVFDDPITSMDYRRIHEVCNRIVALAHDHQIIVFTHNIWFAAELLSKADKKSLKYYDIRLEGDDAGVVTPGSHPRVDTVAQVKATIKKLIEGAERAEGEVKAALVEKGYEHLRNLSEIVVEHENAQRGRAALRTQRDDDKARTDQRRYPQRGHGRRDARFR